MKNITFIFILLITIIVLSTLIFVFFKNYIPLIVEFEKSESCGDGICGPGETVSSCPADCHCDDPTYDEVIGEWSKCDNGKQRRFIQNSCGDTTIEARACAPQPIATSEKEFVRTAINFLDQIEEINKNTRASIIAYNEDIITETTLRSRLNSASKEGLSIYYDLKDTSVPAKYNKVYDFMNKAIAHQLTGIDEALKYFEDNDINHVYSGENWIKESQDYEKDARALLS